MDVDDFAQSQILSYHNGQEVRPIEIDLNSIIYWKREAINYVTTRKDIPNKMHRRFLKKVNSKAKNDRKIIVTLSTKPSRLKYISTVVNRIDFQKYNALIVVNLPRKFGPDALSYPKIPPALTSNKRVVIKVDDISCHK